VGGGREPCHVEARFGDDGHGEIAADAGDLREPVHCGQDGRVQAGTGGRDAVGADPAGGGDGVQGGLDLVLEFSDGPVEERDVVQVDADQHGVAVLLRFNPLSDVRRPS
jgi:hypothetical protein